MSSGGPDLWELTDRTQILFTLPDERGAFGEALRAISGNNVNMTHISSRPTLVHSTDKEIEFLVDVDGTEKDGDVAKGIAALRKVAVSVRVNADVPAVPWFPRQLIDLDAIGKTTTLKEGEGIAYIDHPGFTDPEYKARRKNIADAAMGYSMADDEVPRIEYSETETSTWQSMFTKLRAKWTDVACKEYNEALDAMMAAGVLRYDEIPQLEDVS